MQEITCDKNVFNQKIETTELGNSFKENCAKTIYVLLVTIKVMENIYSHPLQTVLRIWKDDYS